MYSQVKETYPLGDMSLVPASGSCDQTHGYSQSKWTAERMVQQAAEAGLPTCAFRLPQISGSLETGAAPDNRNDLLCDLLSDCIKLGMVPLMFGTLVNITPVDVVAYLVSPTASYRSSSLASEHSYLFLDHPLHCSPFIRHFISSHNWAYLSRPQSRIIYEFITA